ncbi:hypothetical protein VIGAN_04231600 [Vigna angularis var. angularis]|uniref:Uncharacterized protein n=1 Tax=Vigna angularis var. angularis TaxID=157739 RepID=A0A0S3RW83_PHAAN|nr:hypothetical protein VIGAN_04231600 [Vigna angularis var. angularis]
MVGESGGGNTSPARMGPENGAPAASESERVKERDVSESGKAANYVEKLCPIWSENGLTNVYGFVDL